MTEATTPCSVKGCSNIASFQHKLTGQFFEYLHNYCPTCYWRLIEGKQVIELDRDKVPLRRLPVATVDYFSLMVTRHR